MHFDPWHTMQGRHLILAYGTVATVQLSYLAWVAYQWFKATPETKKSAEPI